MTGTGAEEIWEGEWKKYSIQRGVLKKFLILERGPEIFVSFKASKIWGGGEGGLNLDQTFLL